VLRDFLFGVCVIVGIAFAGLQKGITRTHRGEMTPPSGNAWVVFPKDPKSQRRRARLMVGALVGVGALLLGIVIVGGILLATIGDSGTYDGFLIHL
jgi:hypothetical protein